MAQTLESGRRSRENPVLCWQSSLDHRFLLTATLLAKAIPLTQSPPEYSPQDKLPIATPSAQELTDHPGVGGGNYWGAPVDAQRLPMCRRHEKFACCRHVQAETPSKRIACSYAASHKEGNIAHDVLWLTPPSLWKSERYRSKARRLGRDPARGMPRHAAGKDLPEAQRQSSKLEPLHVSLGHDPAYKMHRVSPVDSQRIRKLPGHVAAGEF